MCIVSARTASLILCRTCKNLLGVAAVRRQNFAASCGGEERREAGGRASVAAWEICASAPLAALMLLRCCARRFICIRFISRARYIFVWCFASSSKVKTPERRAELVEDFELSSYCEQTELLWEKRLMQKCPDNWIRLLNHSHWLFQLVAKIAGGTNSS